MDKIWHDVDKIKLLPPNVSASAYQNLFCPSDSNIKCPCGRMVLLAILKAHFMWLV